MDFYQLGPTTLHDLRPDQRGHARALLARHAPARPCALVLPMLYSEMESPSILGLRSGLMKADFLHEVVIALTAKDADEVDRVRRFFSGLPVPVSVLWCEGPEVAEALARLADRGFDLRAFSGKGLAVWLGLGAASETSQALAVHDADIERYDPKILHRLLLPLVVPEMDFYFSKGYYARLTDDRIYGRVVRVMLWPFLDALAMTLPQPSPLLRYLRAFRYPLAGEMAVTSDLARNLRIPTDWGLELGVLGEVYRNCSMKRICQVDLGTYSHKHKTVGADPAEGLQRMTVDVATTVYRLLAGMEGARVSPDMLTTLQVAYRREAQDAIRKYHMDSLANGLRYDRHGEEVIAETLEPLLRRAGEQFMGSPSRDLIGEWLRALSADETAPARIRAPRRVAVKDATLLREAAREAIG